MKTSKFFKAVLTAVAVTASGLSVAAILVTPAAADIASSKATVDAAKRAGTVGEKPDGFLGVVGGADSATQAAVVEINEGRRQVYGQAAAKNGVSIEAAGQSAFVNVILPKLSSGEYYQDASGSWVKK
ncbi:hypothetical protein ABAC460_10785 [Asticcacaulis sp. AC460]|uniref:YdbL family protein n=1 Tax=Asticcacaulis sp. AC460 TaxID=1282360 RepID=UPI0003C3EB4C|nr:YdbL family protein [Asticcacaulis sp. AC460]ESQ90226.1 hypothetical protein ABAC460_10785 [Asticcacaulis sp. AC460]